MNIPIYMFEIWKTRQDCSLCPIHYFLLSFIVKMCAVLGITVGRYNIILIIQHLLYIFLNNRKSMELLLSFVCSEKKTFIVQKHHSYLEHWEMLQAFFYNHVSLDTVEVLKPIVHEFTSNLFPVYIHWINLRKILACILNITKLHISEIKLHWLSYFDSKLRFFLRCWLKSLHIYVHSLIQFLFLILLLILS